jgi:chromate transporter
MKWLVEPREAFRVWMKIGLINFGGPAGQIAMMHRVTVEERRWISEQRFLHALNFCMLLPGPEAQQLATYIGWLMGGVRGGLMAGGLFILPGALFMLGLSILYAKFAEVPLLQGVFYGVKAAVVAIVIEALLRIARRALTTPALRILALSAFVAIFFVAVPFPLIVLGAGIFGAIASRYWPQMLGAQKAANGTSAKAESIPLIDAAFDAGQLHHTIPSARKTIFASGAGLLIWFGPLVIVALIAGRGSVYTDLGFFFSKMAVVTFGGAYAVLAYVADQAVNAYHWLKPAEMLHGLGLAETTPGPLILVLQFVGFLAAYRAGGLDPLVAGMIGAAITLWATFVPSFLWIFVGAPYTESLRRQPALAGALSAITGAVVGVILNLTVWFALHSMFARVHDVHWGILKLPLPDPASFDPATAILALLASIVLLRLHWGMLPVLSLCAAAGVALRLI